MFTQRQRGEGDSAASPCVYCTLKALTTSVITWGNTVIILALLLEKNICQFNKWLDTDVRVKCIMNIIWVGKKYPVLSFSTSSICD